MNVLLLNAYSVGHRERLCGYLRTEWTILTHLEHQPPEHLATAMAEADALVFTRWSNAMPPAPRLKLIQSPAAGIENIDAAALPAGCTVCNVYEHEIGISEYVLLAMLEHCIGLNAIAGRFRAGDWRDGHSNSAAAHGEAFGRSVGLVGYGHIGREVAKRARAFGMRVEAVTRAPRPAPELDRIDGMDGLDAMLGRSDFVVISCPLNEATRGLLDARRLGLMRRDAVLINVSRAAIVDEDALFAALRDHVIGGAVLDVWYNYPGPQQDSAPPSRHPFAELPNVVMTPHCSAWTGGLFERRWSAIAANLDRFARGEPLQNVVLRG